MLDAGPSWGVRADIESNEFYRQKGNGEDDVWQFETRVILVWDADEVRTGHFILINIALCDFVEEKRIWIRKQFENNSKTNTNNLDEEPKSDKK